MGSLCPTEEGNQGGHEGAETRQRVRCQPQTQGDVGQGLGQTWEGEAADVHALHARGRAQRHSEEEGWSNQETSAEIITGMCELTLLSAYGHFHSIAYIHGSTPVTLGC